MQKNKILLVLTRLPYPVTDGTRSKILHNVIEGLAKEFDLEFLITTIDHYEESQIQYLESNFGPVHFFKENKLSRLFIGVIKGLFSSSPFQTKAYTFSKAKVWIAAHAADYSTIYMHTIRTGAYAYALDASIRNKVIIDFNDAISLHYALAQKTASFPLNLYYKIEQQRIRNYEKNLLTDFSNFTVLTEKDAAYLQEHISPEQKGTINFPCIHFGIAIGEPVTFTDSKNIYFIGNIDYAPNGDALTIFLTTVWPMIYQTMPRLQFNIIGKGSPINIPFGADRVHLLGYVENIETILSQSIAMIAPIRFGAGIPTKIIEAMSRGIPVIMTPFAAASIQGLVPGTNCFIVESTDAQSWATHLNMLSNTPSLRNTIGTEGRSLTQQHYSVEKIQEEWRTLVRNSIILSSGK